MSKHTAGTLFLDSERVAATTGDGILLRTYNGSGVITSRMALTGGVATATLTLSNTTLALGGNSLTFSDVTLSRGAANRLDLGSGDSLEIVNGNLVVHNTTGNFIAQFDAASGGQAQLQFNEAGTTRYMAYYHGGSNYFAVWSTDTDGGGTDADVIRIPDGQLSVDGNATFDDNAFDDYDDAMVLCRSFSPERRTTFDRGRTVLEANRDELIEMGVLRRYDDGWVGYNDQRMAALLAGGIYQTRFKVDALTECIKALEQKIAMLEAGQRRG